MSFIELLKKYFEKISIIYHILFIILLIWLIKFKKNEQKINKNLIRCLGIYVILYGCIILNFGPKLFNNEL